VRQAEWDAILTDQPLWANSTSGARPTIFPHLCVIFVAPAGIASDGFAIGVRPEWGVSEETLSAVCLAGPRVVV
jgi:hypothetical protein